MENALLVLALLSGACLGMAFRTFGARRLAVEDRLEGYVVQAPGREKRPAERLTPESVFRRASALLASRKVAEDLQVELLQAGIPLKGEEYALLWGSLALLAPLGTWALSHSPILVAFAAAAGVFGPRLYVRKKQQDKMHKLSEQLGDALVVMSNSLRAGFGFQQAMDVVRRELPPPIATEFEWTSREIQLGVTTEDALLHMGQRVKNEDLDMVISAVLIQRQVGGNLAEILDNIALTIRERARIKGEVRTLTAQGRISGLIVGLLPVGLLVILAAISPGYVESLFQTRAGMMLLGGAALSEVLGVLMIQKIVDIKV